jgi:hypothetical protein
MAPVEFEPSLSRQAAANLRLRSRGHCDRRSPCVVTFISTLRTKFYKNASTGSRVVDMYTHEHYEVNTHLSPVLVTNLAESMDIHGRLKRDSNYWPTYSFHIWLCRYSGTIVSSARCNLVNLPTYRQLCCRLSSIVLYRYATMIGQSRSFKRYAPLKLLRIFQEPEAASERKQKITDHIESCSPDLIVSRISNKLATIRTLEFRYFCYFFKSTFKTASLPGEGHWMQNVRFSLLWKFCLKHI